MSDEVRAYDIKKALEVHCLKDFFMTEVKDGPTQIDQHELRILDAMSIAKSWVHPCIKGFEVKVSRSDFLRDPKWYTYFPLVNEFYMVCPQGMIERSEIPTTCGLLWYRPKSGTILTKQKATYGGGQPTADMLMYIIMNRLEPDHRPFFSSKAEYIEEYMKHKDYLHSLGRGIGTKLMKRVDELEQKLADYDRFESDAKRVRATLDAIDKVLKKHGVSYWSSWDDGSRAKEIDELLTRAYPEELDRIDSNLQAALSTIAKLKGKGGHDEESSPDNPEAQGPRSTVERTREVY